MIDLGKDLSLSLLKNLERLGFPSRQNRFLVACSGGPDSVALLRLAHSASFQGVFFVAVGHINHQLRGRRSNRDAAFVRNLSRRLKTPFFLKTVNVARIAKKRKLGIEAAARSVRYEALGEIARKMKATAVLTAHTMEDQAETVLLNLLRGTGPAGLCGISEVLFHRDIKVPIVRPLLGIRRDFLKRYLQSVSQPYCIDESNNSEAFLRNWIRRRVLPLLRTKNPQVDKHLFQTAAIFQEEEIFWRQWAQNQFRFGSEKKPGVKSLLDFSEFLRYPIAVQRRFLHRVLPVEPQFDVIESVRSHLARLQPFNKASWGGRPTPREGKPSSHVLAIPGENKLPGGWFLFGRISPGRPRKVDRGPWTAFMDWTKVCRKKIVWKSTQPGDRFQPLGFRGTKKLSDFFCDEKVPSVVRRQVPILEANGKVIWAVGMRTADFVKVTQNTKKTLILRARKI